MFVAKRQENDGEGSLQQYWIGSEQGDNFTDDSKTQLKKKKRKKISCMRYPATLFDN